MTSADLEVYEAAPVTLFRTDDPAEVVARATATAQPLADVIDKRGLAVNIQGRKYVRVEGWTLLGTMLGVFPITVWSRAMSEDGFINSGWEARVEARTRDGAVVGAAEAMCSRGEKTWAGRDEYALRSMAQTRATSKALRQPLGFVMTLAGYEATPAEEMDAAPANQLPATPAAAGEPAATDKQLKFMNTLITKLGQAGQDAEKIKDGIKAKYGVTTTKALTKREAVEINSKLDSLLGELTGERTPF